MAQPAAPPVPRLARLRLRPVLLGTARGPRHPVHGAAGTEGGPRGWCQGHAPKPLWLCDDGVEWRVVVTDGKAADRYQYYLVKSHGSERLIRHDTPAGPPLPGTLQVRAFCGGGNCWAVCGERALVFLRQRRDVESWSVLMRGGPTSAAVCVIWLRVARPLHSSQWLACVLLPLNQPLRGAWAQAGVWVLEACK